MGWLDGSITRTNQIAIFTWKMDTRENNVEPNIELLACILEYECFSLQNAKCWRGHAKEHGGWPETCKPASLQNYLDGLTLGPETDHIVCG